MDRLKLGVQLGYWQAQPPANFVFWSPHGSHAANRRGENMFPRMTGSPTSLRPPVTKYTSLRERSNSSVA